MDIKSVLARQAKKQAELKRKEFEDLEHMVWQEFESSMQNIIVDIAQKLTTKEVEAGFEFTLEELRYIGSKEIGIVVSFTANGRRREYSYKLFSGEFVNRFCINPTNYLESFFFYYDEKIFIKELWGNEKIIEIRQSESN